MFRCFGCMKQLVWGDGYDNAPIQEKPLPAVEIDSSNIGTDVVIVKQGRRICGSGGALACAPIAQDKAYFEVKVQSTGIWCIGLGTRKYNVQKGLGSETESWGLRQDGSLVHNNIVLDKISTELEEGDVIGCSYDHVELNFYRNGAPLNAHIRSIKGTVLPAFYVDEGAILDTIFTDFFHSPPPGFAQLMIEQDIL